MEQIYRFDQAKPPILHETMLKAEAERREARRMAVLFSLASLFLMGMVLWFAVSIAPYAPITATVCVAYAAFSLLGGGAAAIVYAQKGGART